MPGETQASYSILTACYSMLGSDKTTEVLAYTYSSNLTTTTVTGPITMWAQPMNIMWQFSDQILFPGSPEYAKPKSVEPSTDAPTPKPGLSSTIVVATSKFSPVPTSSPSNSDSVGTKLLGIGVAVGIAAAIITGTIILIIRRQRMRCWKPKHNANTSNRLVRMPSLELEGKPLPHKTDYDRNRCELEVLEEAQELEEEEKSNHSMSPIELVGSELPPQVHLRRQSSDLADWISPRIILLF